MVILPLKLHINERLNMKYDWQGVLYRLTSRKFLLTVITFLLFIFSEQLGLSDQIKDHLLVTFLGYVGVEGIADVVDRFKE